MTYEEFKSNTGITDILSPEVFAIILDKQSEVEKVTLKQMLSEEAERQNKLKIFNELYAAYKKDNDYINKDVTSNYGVEYIYLNSRGNYAVNSSLLAKHIRNNAHYYIVKKMGSETSFIYWYEDGYYKQISPNELKGKIKEYIPLEIRKPTHWEDTYKELITDNVFITYEDMNTDEHLINFKNGVLDISTWRLINHSPTYKLTFQINTDYNPRAKDPVTWLAYIDTLTEGDEDIKNTLQEWFGLNLSNFNVNICKRAVALYGLGDTGKSKFLTTMADIIGPQNICSRAIQELSTTFGVGDLYGTKAVLIDDQTSKDIEDGSVFKSITGMGYVKAEQKGKQAFTFIYKGGITFTCNNMPYVKDDKGGHMFDRMLIIPCDNVIPKEDRNPLLMYRLREEREGIILWALRGLQRLMNKKFDITVSDKSIEAMKWYRAKNDSLYRFIVDTYTITGDKKDLIKKTEFEANYIKWCSENECEPIHKKNIRERAKVNGIECSKTNGYYFYRGIEEVMPF